MQTPARPGRLDGEVAIVTGSTSGLGSEIARRLAAEGAAVVVTGRNADRGGAVAAAIAGDGADAVFVAADLADPAGRSALVDAAVARFGRLTVLINNAVHTGDDDAAGTVADVDDAAWRRVLEVNLVAPALLCGLVIPRMREAGYGSIVNITSRVVQRANRRRAAYTASKGGLDALTRSISVDFAGAGIRCNAVQCGYILHERRDAALTPQRRAELEAMQLTRLATAADVAHAVVFLASRDSEVITGVTLPVDGGSTTVRARTVD